MELLFISMIIGYWKTLLLMALAGYCAVFTAIVHFKWLLSKLQELIQQYKLAETH